MSTESQPDINKILFLNLVMMLGSTAMQQLGQIINPATGKREVDIEGAQASIDLLAMLKEKTTGNRDDEEERLLNDTLSALQMAYVQAAQTGGEPAEPAGEEATPEAAAEPAEDSSEAEPEETAEEESEPGEVQPPSDEEPKEPKFHKSYG